MRGGRNGRVRVEAANLRTVMRAWLALGAVAALALSIAATGLLSRHVPAPALVQAVPAAAIRTVPRDAAAPAIGVTGTTALPALPAGVRDGGGDAGVTPAAAFSLAGIAAADRARALECLTAAIYYEAGAESDAGQAAVAQVVLNRVRHPAFPASVCGVVYQGSDQRGCQFSFACDGATARVPSRAGWARAARAAAMALAGRVFAPVGLATHYHTYAVTPAWNRSLVMTAMIGAHLFHRWKGYWGTAAAFARRYRGNEPLPGPHLATQVPGPAASVPSPLPATIRPSFADTSRAFAPPAEPDRLPPASTVLDRWKDSGKPLQ